ncbi:hypothetical protein JRO89_XS10G0001500 [Xanthoceras sorbifolium]|uniref:Rieske domain-containing protein n=1 Tax=Xanthoceras sorbifolium TaxID=99658 RepID=A0ABQ8HGZ9_9ROSI|nr:hypothetical protein JRO89_XS10G0001500 [Xanthoceras sorbifolium]
MEALRASYKLETKAPDNEKFDWFSAWCPVIPVCDLDKRVPHGKKVLGLDIVVWWDKNESSWKVFDDACAHKLAPLSEGRIDKLGRLYEVLIENVADVAHVPYAHDGLLLMMLLMFLMHMTDYY